MKKKLLGFYDYTVIMTYCGMLLGLVGIFFAMNGRFLQGVLALMGAGVCDLFDGAVASTKKNRTPLEKRFGIQIDSLSDLISFGVMPGMFLYSFLGMPLFGAVLGALFALCALIRLAYFNVTEEERQDQTDERRSFYLGVPVTMVSLILPLLYLPYELGWLSPRWIVAVVMTMLALAFLTPVQIKKPHGVGKWLLLVMGVVEGVTLIVLRCALR